MIELVTRLEICAGRADNQPKTPDVIARVHLRGSDIPKGVKCRRIQLEQCDAANFLRLHTESCAKICVARILRLGHDHGSDVMRGKEGFELIGVAENIGGVRYWCRHNRPGAVFSWYAS